MIVAVAMMTIPIHVDTPHHEQRGSVIESAPMWVVDLRPSHDDDAGHVRLRYADTDGHVHGGPFVAGSNPICMTFEVTLEEWLPLAPAGAG